MRDDDNCVLVSDLRQMARKIAPLLADETTRRDIAMSGRNTFLEQFTRQAQQTRFNQFLYQFSQIKTL